MNTNNIKTVFENYLKADKTQYAILLNGAWGSGKTFFWKHTLEPIATNNEFKTIYISLNGISKVETLDHLLFIKLLPLINNQENPILKNATTLFTNLLNQTSKKYLNSSLNDIFKDVSVDMFKFSKHIICFDDLERCQIPVKEVLGFINNYVEHKDLKTLILADETNIEITQKGYDNIKEKVIGRVLNFELNIEETVPQLFKKYEKDKADFYDFLIKQRQTLIDLLTEYKQNNLRIIAFYLDILENIFSCFEDVDEKYVQELIFFSALITFEFKKGNLISSQYNNPKGLDSIDEFLFTYEFSKMNQSQKDKDSVEKELTYSQKFYKMYLENQNRSYFYYPSVFSYILSGYINLSELEKEIKNRYPEIISQEIQDFRELLTAEFRSLTDIEFEKLAKSVLRFAKEGKYTIYEYSQIGHFYYFFSENNLIPESNEEITDILIEGLNIAKGRKEINDRAIQTILHFGSEKEKEAKIEKIIKDIHDELKRELNVEQNKELMNSLFIKDNPYLEAVYQKYELSVELFRYIDNRSLFEEITSVSNDEISNLVQRLERRYNSSNIGQYLYEDFEYLKTLRESLEEFLERTENIAKLRSFLLKSLINALDKICNHLESTK
jgi:hypothetical protein